MSSLEYEPVQRIERPDWLDYEEFPFDTNAIEIDGNLIHYVDEGTGPTLLFVHAGPLWSFIFRDVIEELRHKYRCIALDFPGSGLSEASADYVPTIETASVVLESFIDALGIEDSTLVVHDIGGPVAFGVAMRRSELFRGIGIVGSFGWSLNEEFPDIARKLRIVSSPMFKVLDAKFNLLSWVSSTKYEVGRRLSKAGRRVLRAPYRSRQKRKIGTAMIGSALTSDEYLTRVKRMFTADLADRPILLLFGENDPGRQVGFQEKWEEFAPEARSETVVGAHHFPMTDSPHFVSEVITDWHIESVA